MKLNTDNEKYYQDKYNYYRYVNMWVIILSCVAEITYFISDCQLFKNFAYETFLPRFIIILPMLFFVFVNNKTTNYKIMVPLSYFTIHCAMWCTIWSIYYLPDKSYASDGFIIMHFMFLAVGLCSPMKYSVISHSLVIINILTSHLFNNYQDLHMMISLGLPCLIAIEVLLYLLDKRFKEHLSLKQQLEQNVYIDQLTQVYNRNIMQQIIGKCNELTFENVYMAILDIDFFKKINDTYGHEKGDIILSFVAKNVLNSIDKEDYLIRWGGEEFVIIMPNTTKEKVLEKMQKIKENLKGNNGVCDVTVSIGISKYISGDYHNCLTKADTALYEAKENGRNQYIFSL